jgi:hypothetical protein
MASGKPDQKKLLAAYKKFIEHTKRLLTKGFRRYKLAALSSLLFEHFFIFSGPGGIRTLDLTLRRRSLYPC